MLLIRTNVAPSSIHGVGVFAAEAAVQGQPIWRYAEGLDLVIPLTAVPTFPEAFRAFLETYSYLSADLPGAYVLSCDHAKFLNHSDEPNTLVQPFVTVARRPIEAGDEITCDYRSFVVGWDGFGPETVPV